MEPRRKAMRPQDDNRRRWVVVCSNNDRAVCNVLAPIKPEFCPMCGARAKSVQEIV